MIPTEIVDHILRFLHFEQDYTTLESCSDIFPQIVNRLLYTHITFRSPSPNSHPLTIKAKRTYIVDPTKFSLLLVDRPYIANYARVVCIIADLFTTRRLQVVASILPKLSCIESMALNGESFIVPRWASFDPKFRTTFRNSIRLPSVKEVAITRIDFFPLDAFDGCKNLENLVLTCYFTGGEGASTSPYPRLCSLRVDAQLHLTRIISWMKSNTLHTLSHRMNHHMDLISFLPLIKACSTTLVNLELDSTSVVTHRDYHELSIRFAFPGFPLPLLQQITIHSLILVPLFNSTQSTLPFFTPFLISMLRVSSPSTIRLCLNFKFCIPVDLPSLVDQVDWSPIVDLLVLPVFRHPIELYIREGQEMGSALLANAFRRNSVMNRLLESGEVALINDA